MPLTATAIKRTAHDDRKAIGMWMQTESDKPIRVFVTYEALAHIDPLQINDLDAALAIFDANRTRLENLASARYDASGADEGEHEGQPILILRSNDID
jgi:hypothetical protein